MFVAWAVAGLLALAVVGLSVGLAMRGGPASSRVSGPSGYRIVRPGSGGAIPRPGSVLPGTQGPVLLGTVASVQANSFTVNAVFGQTVTVNEQSSTLYFEGSTPAHSSAVTQGARVVVEGSHQGTTVQATRVFVLGEGGFGSGSL